MASSICPWSFLASTETPVPEASKKSFAQAVAVGCDSDATQFPPRVVLGDTVRIRIIQAVYEVEMKDCSTHLHGKVTMQKNDVPITTQMLRIKLKGIWKNLNNWSVTPLGRGCFEFKFNSIADMRQALAQVTISLNLVY